MDGQCTGLAFQATTHEGVKQGAWPSAHPTVLFSASGEIPNVNPLLLWLKGKQLRAF